MKEFNDKCYGMLEKVPKGRVVTYKEIAIALKSKAYRAVGRAMKMNSDKSIPCFKVVKSNGEIGGFNRGKKEKIRLLQKEGIEIKKGRVDLKKCGWKI